MTTIDYTYGMPLVECGDTIDQVLDAASIIGVQILNTVDGVVDSLEIDGVNPDGWYDFDIICSDDSFTLAGNEYFYADFSVYGPMDRTEVMSVTDEGVRKIVECRPYVLHLADDDTDGVWLQVNVETSSTVVG